MATERRYLKGDVVEILRSLYETDAGIKFRVTKQFKHNGVVAGVRVDYAGDYYKRYAHQVKLVKRPWWNRVRLLFAGKVVEYKRSQAR